MTTVAIVGLGYVGLPLPVKFGNLPRSDALIAAVAHREFVQKRIDEYFPKLVENGCFIDVKSRFDASALSQAGIRVWRL